MRRSRFVHEENDEKEDNRRVERADAVGPAPCSARHEEAKGEWRQEGRDDEAHGPDVELTRLEMEGVQIRDDIQTLASLRSSVLIMSTRRIRRYGTYSDLGCGAKLTIQVITGEPHH